MTRIEWLRIPWDDPRLTSKIDSIEVTKDQLGTIVDGWLILDEGQDKYVHMDTVYARAFSLDAIRYFASSKKINDDRLTFICELPGGQYRYYVETEK
jgi:hypothetical protein